MCLFGFWSERAWWQFFTFNNVYMPLVVGCITTVWLTIFGFRDFRRLLVKLRTLHSDASDDGLVNAGNAATPHATKEELVIRAAIKPAPFGGRIRGGMRLVHRIAMSRNESVS